MSPEILVLNRNRFAADAEFQISGIREVFECESDTQKDDEWKFTSRFGPDLVVELKFSYKSHTLGVYPVLMPSTPLQMPLTIWSRYTAKSLSSNIVKTSEGQHIFDSKSLSAWGYSSFLTMSDWLQLKPDGDGFILEIFVRAPPLS